MTVMDRLLPARIRPPEMPEGISVVLVIDKSSSMEGEKIELARLSASAVVDHLRPVDTIGILIFDNAYSWAASPRRAVDKAGIKRLVAGIVPDGGTQIPAALEEAYRKILATKSTYKHIVLLTDGISEEADSLSMAKDALLHQVSISTIGLGQDVNKSYLEKIADASGGHGYFLDNPTYLQQLLLKDIEDFTAKTVVEKRITPIVQDDDGLLHDVDLKSAPPLQGYVRYAARPGARTLLAEGDEKHDPLLVRWQYGLGRVAVFASDAKSRWASQWLPWRGFDRFWTNVAHDLTQRNAGEEITASFDRGLGQLKATYYGERPPAPYFFFGPSGEKGPLRWHKSGSGYQASAAVKWMPGLWVVRPEDESRSMPETAVIARDAESPGAVNEHLLRDIAAITGGVYNPTFSGAPEPRKPRPRHILLWPLLLWLAIGLMLVELAARKMSSIKDGPLRNRRKIFHFFQVSHRLRDRAQRVP
jgi:uncharacterized protein YegL